jgi:thiol-disulfide isomerase/thioredoxin
VTLRRVDDLSLRHLVTLNELESLSLTGSELTDAGMLYLVSLPKLRELNLSVTEVSDESFEIFQEMKSLRTLDLRDTLVTQKGVDAFAKARPDVRVQAAPATSFKLAEQKQRKPLKRLQIGKTVPDLKATTLDGKPLTLSEFRGKFLVVFCWATWCGPCKEEIPYLQVLQKTFANDPRVAILGLSLDKAADDASKYVKNHDMPWPQGYISLNVVDQAGEAVATGGLPSSFLLAPDGIVLARGLRGEKIKATLEDVLRGDSGTITLPMP